MSTKCYPIPSISHLQPGFTAPTLLAVLLGVNGLREVVIKNGERAGERQIVTSLYIADASEPFGLELSVWGENARKLITLPPMSILHIPGVTKRKCEKAIITLSCDRPQEITTLQHTKCNCKSSSIAINLKQWHRRFHGSLTSTLMQCDTTSIPNTNTINCDSSSSHNQAKPLNNNLHWIRSRIISIRIRTEHPNQQIRSALQSAVTRHCAGCGTITNLRGCINDCECPPCKTEYQLDEHKIAIRLQLQHSILAHCAGADLARLILHEPHELLDIQAATRAVAILRALAADNSLLHIALRRDPGESLPRLHELRF